jgi:hypothetical protein
MGFGGGTQRVPGRPRISSFWPLSARNVADSGHKLSIAREVQPPSRFHRVSRVMDRIYVTHPTTNTEAMSNDHERQ